MKSSILALSLMGLAAAQPHQHAGRHAAFHEKRDIVTQTEIVTAYADDVVVYVDENGKPLYTTTLGLSPATAGIAQVSTATVAAATNIAHNNAAAAPAAYTSAAAPKPAPAYTPSAAPAPAYTPKAPAPDHGDYMGIGYSPYTASGGCKSQDEVNADFQRIPAMYNIIRIYGTDCDQVNTVGNAAKAKGMKLFAGVYDINNLEGEIGHMKAWANGDWSSFHTISIGNELVNNGEASPAQVTGAIASARSILGAAGFTGHIVTVDTFVATIAHPELCHASDFAAVNAHSFFDSQATPDKAGSWTKAKQAAVSAACGGMDTWITEGGWPNGGHCNGDACPTPENQQTAINSLHSAFSTKLFTFSLFDTQWKDTVSNFGTERHWGVYGVSSS